LAKYTLLWYGCTTLVAATIGAMLARVMIVPLVSPMDASTVAGLDTSAIKSHREMASNASPTEQALDLLYSMTPSNILYAAANDNLLGWIVVTLVVGALSQDPNKRTGERSVFVVLAEESERLVRIIISFLIRLAPVGVFSLILPSVMAINLGVSTFSTSCRVLTMASF
jgi:Na+/H+-dicarboxylate symporter